MAETGAAGTGAAETPAAETPAAETGAAERVPARKRPLYPQLLRLRHVHPNAWQRAVLGEGMALLGALLAMADLASAWAIVVLPVAVAGVVKAHDLVAGQLQRPAGPRDAGTGPPVA